MMLTKKQKRIKRKYSKGLFVILVLANAILSAMMTTYVFVQANIKEGFLFYVLVYLFVFCFVMIVLALNLFVLYLYRKYAEDKK